MLDQSLAQGSPPNLNRSGWLVWWLCTASLRLSFFPIFFWHCFMIFLPSVWNKVNASWFSRSVQFGLRFRPYTCGSALWSLLTRLTSKSDNLQKWQPCPVRSPACCLSKSSRHRHVDEMPMLRFEGRRRLEQSVQPPVWAITLLVQHHSWFLNWSCPIDRSLSRWRILRI